MTLKECYESFNGDYDNTLKRLMNEVTLKKFLLKFQNDKSYDSLLKAIEGKNYEEAFRAAHTLKGVAQTLGITPLIQSSTEITEALRHNELDNLSCLLSNVTKDYNKTIAAISNLA
jgi:HPt (histidine-containing phosphotransfer) domain-containing protein